MNATKFITEFSKYPLFTINDIVRFGHDRNYAKLLLHRFVKRDIAFKISKGIYTLHDDPLIFATHMVYPSYFSLWTALRYYDITTQLPREIYIVSSRVRKDLIFNGIPINFFKTKFMWGYHKEKYKDFEIFVADKEKLIIDSLHFKSVPFYEVVNAIKVCKKEKLINYCIKMGKKSIMKRIGYLLEHFGYFSEDLLKHARDRNVIPLNPFLPKQGNIDSKWCIYVNEAIE